MHFVYGAAIGGLAGLVLGYLLQPIFDDFRNAERAKRRFHQLVDAGSSSGWLVDQSEFRIRVLQFVAGVIGGWLWLMIALGR